MCSELVDLAPSLRTWHHCSTACACVCHSQGLCVAGGRGAAHTACIMIPEFTGMVLCLLGSKCIYRACEVWVKLGLSSCPTDRDSASHWLLFCSSLNIITASAPAPLLSCACTKHYIVPVLRRRRRPKRKCSWNDGKSRHSNGICIAHVWVRLVRGSCLLYREILARLKPLSTVVRCVLAGQGISDLRLSPSSRKVLLQLHLLTLIKSPAAASSDTGSHTTTAITLSFQGI